MITRIQALKIFYGLSTRALALKCGMNQPTVDRMLKGINAINLNFISSILTAFPDISAEWLLRGEGEMLKLVEQDLNNDKLMKLVDTITFLQETINAKSDSIATLNDRIKQLENQPK